MHVYSNLSQDSCFILSSVVRAVWAEGLGGIEGVVGRSGLGRGGLGCVVWVGGGLGCVVWVGVG